MKVTYFVVQAFQLGKKGALIPDLPMQVQSREQARRHAERLASTKAGVIAFSREGDPTTGDYEDAMVLFSYGKLPSEADDMAA